VPNTPDPCRFAADGGIAELLVDAGFSDVVVESVELHWPAQSLDDWWEHMRITSTLVGRATADLSPAEHYELRDVLDRRYAEFVQADGSVLLPGRTWVASAEV